MIIQRRSLRILADTIAAILVAGENSTVYTTGGAIPCSEADAQYFNDRWEYWVEEQSQVIEIDEDEEDEEEA